MMSRQPVETARFDDQVPNPAGESRKDEPRRKNFRPLIAVSGLFCSLLSANILKKRTEQWLNNRDYMKALCCRECGENTRSRHGMFASYVLDR